MQPLVELTDDQFDSARELVYQAAGIRVADSKRTLLSNRLRQRIRALGYTNFANYLSFLNSTGGRGEFPEFINAITTNETFFFRNPEQYDWLRSRFLQEVSVDAVRGRRKKTLRIWSAACSTGEEPYSIAICLLENRLKLNGWDTAVVATDISGDALQTARHGIYRKRAVELVKPEQIRRYFGKSDEGERWAVKPAVRELVRFQQHNLMRPLNEEAFDCIFLKNVLIYFDEDSKRTVLDCLIRRLAPGGYLVIGLSEGVFNMLDPLVKRQPWLFQKESEHVA